jgi:UDP-3-O-[3-hydroxymyristoyl] glucosamine N-acyltransferase
MNTSSFPRPVDTPLTVESLSARSGTPHEVLGNANLLIGSVGSPGECQANSLVFLRPQPLDSLQKAVDECRAGALIVNQPVKVRDGQTVLLTADPLALFIKALHLLFTSKPQAFIHPTAVVSATAQIADSVSIGAYSVIEAGVTVEQGCSIGAHCFIGENTHIARGTVIQNNASLGGVGLGFHFAEDGERLFFPHLGAVRIGIDAVIGSGCVIARGQLSDTVIGAGSRLGNLVNVGHNVRIGNHCAISSGTSIAGGVQIGDHCDVGVGVCFNAKITVSDRCRIGMGSVVTKSLPPGVSVFGNPAKPLPTMDKF